MKSRYLDKFQKVEGTYTLFGSKILLERVELGEVKSKGGLIIADSKEVRADLRLQKPHVGIVLAVGEGYYDAEEKKNIPLDVVPGNVIILNGTGIEYYSVFPGLTSYSGRDIGLTVEANIQMKFDSIEKYQEYVTKLEAEVVTTQDSNRVIV